ncbi:hypothetical protein SANTM175S_00332 [Streptomyces antimycoticus]
MKPARSGQSTARLPSAAATACAVPRASLEVSTVCTTSTSRITGAGLKKCIPMTSSGRRVAIAHAMTGRLEVEVASTAPGAHTRSRSAKTARLTSMSSATASTTRSQVPSA